MTTTATTTCPHCRTACDDDCELSRFYYNESGYDYRVIGLTDAQKITFITKCVDRQVSDIEGYAQRLWFYCIVAGAVILDSKGKPFTSLGAFMCDTEYDIVENQEIDVEYINDCLAGDDSDPIENQSQVPKPKRRTFKLAAGEY